MKRLLITGATGNVGLAVIKALNTIRYQLTVIAGMRDIDKEEKLLAGYNIIPEIFDFTDASTYGPALANCDILFLLRPPAISDVTRYFKPLIASAKNAHVSHIVFLSVQGVEKSNVIPHHKIEQLIVESQIPYTFLRPAYFMQNFSTTLKHDLVAYHRIYLPAGNAKFTLVDVRNIGAVAAEILIAPERHINQKYELTSNEKLTFTEMAQQLSIGLGVHITYKSPDLLQFFLAKKREKMPGALIFVMIMLHYFPRFQTEPCTTDWVYKITGRQPGSFEKFIAGNKMLLQ